MTVVIKVGSNVATNELGETRDDVLTSICAQIAELEKRGTDVVLVTSGAIARGMKLLGMQARPHAMAELQASSAVGQGQLYRRYDELLSAHGLKTAQILLTFGDMSARANYINARQTLRKLLEWHVVPVINENDTTATDEISFGDNDFLAAQVAILVKADLLVLATDIDALYTSDPTKNDDAQPIREVDDFAEIAELEIGASASAIGSGGMASKVVAAEMATAGGIETIVCSGRTDGSILRAIDGEGEGTRFTAHQQPHSSFKLWLRYAKESRGTLTIDPGAARALREQGTSLLPVGIVDVAGDFSAGDAVEIAASGNGAGPVGKGIVNYSADELRRIKGLKSAEVQELMPRATDEAVHRDYLVLT
ncbi:MAG TPA: glutamate 5-kinase [Solirubrobacterales bacterium]|jgi:glutamate 5-kinase|nr:glutamate 5-kinase [Solirubrobacterales bacterium]